jgi:hypothetical protein
MELIARKKNSRILTMLASYQRKRIRMQLEFVIRPKTRTDTGTITDVTVAAFETLEISNHTEQFIIGAERAVKALTVSLVQN